MNKKISIILLILIVLFTAAFAFAYFANRQSIGSVNNFEECAKLGFPVMESYPRQCRAGNKTFIEKINENKSNGNVNEPAISPDCKIAGCSGQLCVNADGGDIITTCEYRAEYICYKSARCEKQSNGACGWTETVELLQCLLNLEIKN